MAGYISPHLSKLHRPPAHPLQIGLVVDSDLAGALSHLPVLIFGEELFGSE